ncbi:MAG: hypothetical protein ACR2IE_15530 [Candidatus Sumerlaeaceae bacterium]
MAILRVSAQRLFVVCLIVIALGGASIHSSLAIETKVIRDETFTQFNQGESTGTELLASGRLKITARAQRLEKTEDGVAWCLAIDPVDASVYYSTGHSGKVYRHTSGAKPELWADLTEVEAVSLVVDPTGALLIGASPGGKIYRVVQPGKPQLFFETREQYVWDMAFDAKGLLYAATGPNGKIFRIRGERNGEVFYDSDATNVMSLGFDSAGNVVAGTQGKAFVLRLNAQGKAYVMYASTEDEVRALALDSTGNLYAAINSARTSSIFDRTSDAKEDKPSSVLNTPSAAPTPTPTPKPGAEGESPLSGLSSGLFGSGSGGQSSVIQIQPSGFVTSFWSSPEGPIHAMMSDPETSSMLVAAGKRGKIYRVTTSDANHSLIADVEEPMVLSLARLNGRMFFSTANKAAIYELVTTGPVQESLFASRSFNAGSTVKWGNLYYEAEESSGSEVLFETRSGNTAEPSDGTWSEWSRATRVNPRIVTISSPVGQYLQYRLTMRAPVGSASPVMDNVQAFYVQQNAAPVIRNIDITKLGGGTPPSTGGSSPFGTMASSIGARLAVPVPTPASGSDPGSPPVTSSRSSALSSSSSPYGPQPSAIASRSEEADLRPMGSGFAVSQNTQRVAVTWEASDPNQDKLRYKLYYRGEDEAEWKLIEEDLSTPRFMFSTEAIPDGKYRVKVEASDAAENDETSATTVNLVSRIYVVDNTAPKIETLQGTKVGPNAYEITALGSDETSILAAAEYNMDAEKEWRAVSPEDGIFDLQRESFRFRAKPAEKKQDLTEHTLSLRVYDREGNSHVKKVLLK